jgi:hypothetical protein
MYSNLPSHTDFEHYFDETLAIRNKPKHPKKGEYKEKNRRTPSKKTKEPPKRVNHNWNIKFLTPLLTREAYQIVYVYQKKSILDRCSLLFCFLAPSVVFLFPPLPFFQDMKILCPSLFWLDSDHY